MAKKNQNTKMTLGDKSKLLSQKAILAMSKLDNVPLEELVENYENLIEELNVHQIELEHQNETLTSTQQNLALANDKFLDLFENAPIGYLLLSSDFKILKVNKTLAQMFDKKPSWFYEKKINDLINENYQDDVHFHFLGLKNLAQSSKSDVLMKVGNGKQFFARIISNLSYDNTQEMTFRTAVMDVSYEKEIEQKLIDEKNRANYNERIKAEFLANMSHEIRTPLNGVIGFVDLLSQTNLDSIQREYCKNSMVSARSLLRVINDILDFSKIEAGKMDISYEMTDVQALLYEVADIVKHDTAIKGLELIVDIPKNSPTHILIDPARLRQILMNLIGNAVKFTDDGEVELKFFATEANSDSNEMDVVFEIRDTGIGISSDQIKMLFKAFSQADMASTRKFGGTGLGLVISTALARMMNGNVEVTSQKGIGSTFSVTFPNVEVYHHPSIQKPISLNNVLLVDAHPSHANVIERYLKENATDFLMISDFESEKHAELLKNIDLMVVNHCKLHVNAERVVNDIQNCCNDEFENKRFLILCNAIEYARLSDVFADYSNVFFLIKPVSQSNLVEALSTENRKLINAEIDDIDSQNQSGKTILIVEDVEMNLLLVSKIISKHFPNVQIVESKNGQEALECMLDIFPDLILMDIQMPIMDGYEATHIIRSKYAHRGTLPIVALTAHAMTSEQEKCKAVGMNDFITKPITSARLIEVVNKYLTLNH
jgi:PAS domain S-box-containing protein